MTTNQQPYSVQQQPPPSASERCARCDQPATVVITDAPGNVRCEVHAAGIFAPSTGATAGRMSGPLFDEGLLRILSAGGCRCDPPGVGEEFCTGHCHLRAEVAQLRADLAQAQAEREVSQRIRAEAFEALGQANQQVSRLLLERSELRAQVEEMRGVVEAARWIEEDGYNAGPRAALMEALRNLPAVLDQAQPQEQQIMRPASS